jgi:hypothetical protein
METKLTRHELYDLAWRQPMVRLAERFGVSSSYLARVFTELRIPRPPRGYWAQLEFGKSPPKADLPPARPGEITEWRPGTFVGSIVDSTNRSKSAETNAFEVAESNESAPSKNHLRGRVLSSDGRTHELLVGARPQFLKTRPVDNDILRPLKRILVDIVSSEAKLDDALATAQALFTFLNAKGFHIGFGADDLMARRADIVLFERTPKRRYHRATWAPDRPTVVHFPQTPIGLTLFEMTEEIETMYVSGRYVPVRDLTSAQLKRFEGPDYWRSGKEVPTGRLCLQAYCPSQLVSWTRQWQESETGKLLQNIPRIASELQSIVPEVAELVRIAEIKAEEAHQRRREERLTWLAEQQRKARDAAIQDAKKDLLAAIAAWDEDRRVQSYFTAVEAQAGNLPEKDAAEVLERLDHCRSLVENPDPITLLKTWRAPHER